MSYGPMTPMTAEMNQNYLKDEIEMADKMNTTFLSE